MFVPVGPEEGSHGQSAVVSGERLRWRGVVRVVATLSLVGAVLTAVAVVIVPMDRDEALGWVTVVIGDWIPTWWTAELALVVAGIAGLLAARIIAPPSPERRARVLRIVLTVVLVITVPVSMLAVVWLSSSRYSVLAERSAGGCRVAVQEFSFLFAGRGSAGVVQPGSWTVDWLADYSADDGYMPFSAGTYSLDWEGKTAVLEVRGTIGNPTGWHGEAPTIDCVR